MANKIIALILFSFSNPAFSMGRPVSDLPHFHEVEKGKIYRGGQPTEDGLILLSEMRMRTVLNLRNESPVTTHTEERSVRTLGMNFISVPLSGARSPSDQTMSAIEAILSNRRLHPIFVHCKLGKDRTGLVIGLHRVFSEAVPPETAYQEMLEYGFHPKLIGLDHYFEEKTGWHHQTEEETPLESGNFPLSKLN